MLKKTKIVATVSDLRCSVDFIRELHESGMDVVRINSAHVTTESATQVVKNVREVSDRIAILIDTKGPELRITGMAGAWINGIPVELNEIVRLKGTGKGTPSSKDVIYVTDADLYDEVFIGAVVLIDDGEIELEVIDKKSNMLICRANNSGTIKGKKSVNIPNVKTNLPSLTGKDVEFIHWAVDMNLDFIAHSFVRKKEDVLKVQRILDERDSHIKIISKIENQEGVDNIDEILDVTYGVMVARGDLGVELPAEEIPIAQRSLVNKCIASKKPVIIATQMLHSMILSPRPTRAEVSDIANAIYQRVDAIMLSGETASGNYPVEAVQTMARIARKIESDTRPMADIEMVRINNEITAQLSRSAVRASINLDVKAILFDSLTGRTGRYLAAFRSRKPVYAVCYHKYVVRELALSYGIEAIYQKPFETHESFLGKTLQKLQKQKALTKNDLVVVVGGNFGAAQGASFLEIGTADNLQRKTEHAGYKYNEP
ncbi:MAG: pyruvate kinase [Rikenellaceae bacterium]|jgi:pyruvate kinase|nr:pyruvate kinase [Rikenellaceae bacterium]